MKKILFVLITSLAAANLYSQSASKTTFGIRAGANFQNLNGKDASGDKLENKVLPGFNIGANAEVLVAPEFYFQPGVLFTTKGAKDENDSDFKTKLSYIEVPLNVVYKPIVGAGRLLLGFGPYVAFGMGGKLESGSAETDVEWDSEISPAESLVPNHFKRFDAGANLLFGYELSNRLSAQLNAQLGLLNIRPDVSGVDDESTVKNTGFGISLGYRF